MSLFVRSINGFVLGIALFGQVARAAEQPSRPEFNSSTATREDVDFTTVPGRFMGRLEYPIHPDKCKPKSGKGYCGGICTATLVGPALLATAAHCVMVEEHTADGPQSWSMKRARFRLHYTSGKFTAESAIVGVVQENFGKTLPSFTGKDWTLLKLKTPLGRKFGWIELSPLIAPPGVQVAAAGYSNDWHHSEIPGIDRKCGTLPPLANPKPRLAPFDGNLHPLNVLDYGAYYFAYLMAKSRWRPIESSYFTTCQLNRGGSGGPLVTTIGSKRDDGSVAYKTFLIGINDTIVKTSRGIISQQADTSRYYHAWLTLLTQDLYQEISDRAKGNPQDAEKQAILKEATAVNNALIANLASLTLSINGPLNLAADIVARVQALDTAAQKLGKLREKMVTPKVKYQFGAAFKDDLAPLTVAKVEPGSPADQLGFEPGDKIIGIDGYAYPSLYEFHALLNRANGKVKMLAAVGEDEERTEFGVELPAVTK